MKNIIDYGEFKLIDITADAPEQWEMKDATYARVSLPISVNNFQIMGEKGFVFVDRMHDVNILPSRTNLDYTKLIRTKAEFVSDRKDEILEIAVESFKSDRRFHLSRELDDVIARKVLTYWVNDIKVFLICKYKDEIAGFLSLKEINSAKTSIHLAAVREKYRATGMAVSLYSSAIQYATEKGYTSIMGNISTANIAVVNLYSYLGASFSNPRDLFLKEL